MLGCLATGIGFVGLVVGVVGIEAVVVIALTVVVVGWHRLVDWSLAAGLHWLADWWYWRWLWLGQYLSWLYSNSTLS